MAIFIFLNYLLASTLMAQTVENHSDQPQVDIDLVELFHEQDLINKNSEPNEVTPSCRTNYDQFPALDSLAIHSTKLLPFLTATSTPEIAKKGTCLAIEQMKREHKPPLSMQVKDEDGHTWKIRFHFGYNRIQYNPTNIDIKSSQFTGTIKNFQFNERTSGEHYDPKSWKDLQTGLNWIDEPTNTIGLSIENNKNSFYLTAIHPKFLKLENATAVDSVVNDQLDPDSLKNNMNSIGIQNTHRFMNYQIGYGRKFKIVGTDKKGKLTYIPRIDIGITFGAAQTFHLDKDNEVNQHTDQAKIQGTNYSIGHRLEYQKGIFAVFVEQKQTATTMNHAFLDGEANYNLIYSATSFGVVVDIFKYKTK